MEVLEILRAYEIFHSHGLEVNALLSRDSNRSNKDIESKEENPKYVEECPKRDVESLLAGNTQWQLTFLSQVFNQSVHKYDNVWESNHDGANIGNINNSQGNQSRPCDTVSSQDRGDDSSETLKVNISVSTENQPDQAKVQFDDGKPTQQKMLEELTVADLRLLMCNMGETYRKGIFENHILKEIISFINNDDEDSEFDGSKESEQIELCEHPEKTVPSTTPHHVAVGLTFKDVIMKGRRI